MLRNRGLAAEALGHYRQAVQLGPGDAHTHSNALACEHYVTGVTAAGLAAAHARFDERHAARLRAEWRPFPAVDPGRPPRLGFVSADLKRHPVGYFLVKALEGLKAAGWETVCYSNNPYRDALTERLAAAAGAWREVSAASDRDLAELVRGDRIDLLFDLAGHTAGHRLLAFARRPAPVQLTWIGYVGTTGLAAMDYLVADRFHVPPGAEADYREAVLRLPDGYVCYEPPREAPPVAPPPVLSRGT